MSSRTASGEQLATLWRSARIAHRHPGNMSLIDVASLSSPLRRKDAVVRRALTEDADLLAALGARTFYDSYASAYSAEDMQTYISTSFNTERIAKETAEPGTSFLIAEAPHDGALLGYAKLRLSEKPACVKRDGVELQRIYVDKPSIGSGVGTMLLVGCLEAAAQADRRSMWLGVDRSNERAINFYAYWGFRIVGTHDFILGRTTCIDLVMEVDIT